MTAFDEVVSEKTRYLAGIFEYPRALLVAELSDPPIRASESIPRATYAVFTLFVGVM